MKKKLLLGIVCALAVVVGLVYVLVPKSTGNAGGGIAFAGDGGIYGDFLAVSETLQRYEEQGEVQELTAAAKMLYETAKQCAAYGDDYSYVSPTDSTNAVNTEWVIRFFKKCSDYLYSAADGTLGDEGAVTVKLIAEVFTPTDNGAVTFSSIFWNTCQSELFNDPEFTILMEYDTNQKLIPIEF